MAAKDHKTSLLDADDLHNCDQHINIIFRQYHFHGTCDQKAMLLDKKVTLEMFWEPVNAQDHMDAIPQLFIDETLNPHLLKSIFQRKFPRILFHLPRILSPSAPCFQCWRLTLCSHLTWLLEPFNELLYDILDNVAIRPRSGTLGRIHCLRGRR